MKKFEARRHILFVHNSPTRFVVTDRLLLEEAFDVRDWYVGSTLIDLPATLRAVAERDIVYCWFASWHSLFPVIFAKLLHKPCIVVIGGYDTALLPEANYGSQRHILPRLITRTIIRLADRLIANSQSAHAEAIANAGASGDKVEVIYHGFEETHPTIAYERALSALNVGGVWQENLMRKGLLPFVRAAKYLPDVAFIHVGRWFDNSISTLRELAGTNVTFAGYVGETDLLDLYGRSSVYVQPSLHEGFGMSVAEAMLGGCIPVVTRVGSLPEVVGDTGIYCKSNSPTDVAFAIKQALYYDKHNRQRAKDRILTNFPMRRRKEALHQLIERMGN